MDEKKNVGFFFRYSPAGNPPVRVNTRSLTSAEDDQKSDGGKNKKAKEPTNKLLAFKALPPKSYFVSSNVTDPHPLNEEESMKAIGNQIAEAVNNVRKTAARNVNQQPGEEENTQTDASTEIKEVAQLGELVVKQGDIISLSEAKRSTGYLETIGNSLKKLVWAS
jgi:hypothetical protein